MISMHYTVLTTLHLGNQMMCVCVCVYVIPPSVVSLALVEADARSVQYYSTIYCIVFPHRVQSDLIVRQFARSQRD
jgi:hypothetical protein